jgi:hypothetical protein
MQKRSLFHGLIGGLTVGLVLLAQPAAPAAWVVAAGYDLFQTETGTSFMGVDFTGVPLGTYNFGGSIGTKNTGFTDTIIQRLQTVTNSGDVVGGTGTTALKVDALQLVSTTPANFGLGVGTYYATLDPNQPTGSTMTIEFNSNAGGTFASLLNINIDLHFGSLSGPIANPGGTEITLTQGDLTTGAGAFWGRVAPPGAVLITGANYLLDGKDINQDFWPGGTAGVPGSPFSESSSSGSETHVVRAANLPEPSTWVMLVGVGLIVPAYARWGRRRRA